MFVIDTHIARPVDAAFGNLEDIEDTPRWCSAVQAVEVLTPGEAGVGTRYRFRRKIAGASVVNEVEISEFARHQVHANRSLTGPSPFAYRRSLSPLPAGTRLRLEGHISGEGLTGPLAMLAPLASAFYERGMRFNLQVFKGIVENRRATPRPA